MIRSKFFRLSRFKPFNNKSYGNSKHKLIHFRQIASRKQLTGIKIIGFFALIPRDNSIAGSHMMPGRNGKVNRKYAASGGFPFLNRVIMVFS